MKGTHPFIIIMFTIIVCSLSYSHLAYSDPIQISLQQAIDKNCDGIAEKQTLVVSGDCIIYSITTTNTGNADLYKIMISGKIPKHTRIYQTVTLKNDIFAQKTTHVNRKNRIINSLLEKLESGGQQAIILQYAVQVL